MCSTARYGRCRFEHTVQFVLNFHLFIPFIDILYFYFEYSAMIFKCSVSHIFKFPYSIAKSHFVFNFAKWPANMSAACNEFFQKMFALDSKDRYFSIAQLQSLPFFASVGMSYISL
jgi:hypothetical protein